MVKKKWWETMTPKNKRDDATRKVFSVLLDVDLVKKIKLLAVEKDTSISALVESALKAYLTKKK